MAKDPDTKKIVEEARKRFKRCQGHEAVARRRYVQDIKFANGDARNHYQWPEDQRSFRDADAKPCFTINKTRQHCLQIINDARQNKQAIKINPVGGGASYDSAQIYTGLIRHIEYQSNAQNVYTTATRTQVQGGVGYWRVVTDYADADSFDQEIFIRRIKDPLSVYLDPDCNEADRSDAKYGFVFDSMPKEEAELKWPDLKGRFPKTALNEDDAGWIDEDHVRIAEYFRRSEVQDELVAVTIPPEQTRQVVRLSKLAEDPRFADVKPKDLRASLEAMGAQFRKVTDHTITWYKIAGDTVVDQREWPGRYIPIVMLIGEETVIDGEMDRKGHTRALIDPQMNYNYWTSEAATQVALQGKSPYLADLRAIEGHENYWDNANRKNFPYLPYNGYSDDSGEPIPAPQRQQPPVMAQAYIQGMNIAAEELRMTSGQYQASYGAPGNETSGVAIQQRQRQADNATYHFVDHLANAIRYTGRIVVDLIPKVYDTQRVVKIMADDGTVKDVLLDPQHAQAYFEQKAERGEEVKAIFNPNVGKYAIEADVGPAFATQRQEAFNAISQIAQQNHELMNVVGDLLFKAADFPMANEIAERLRRMVPPQALGEGPTQQVQALQQQNATLQQMIQALTQKLSESKAKQDAKDDKTMVDAYRAETDRIETIKEFAAADPAGFMALVRGTVREAVGQPDPMGDQPPGALPAIPPQGTPQPMPQQPPQGGFSMPGMQQ